ncbi:MAG TPA: LysR family transcriptional regulator [Lacunisphaera sp.]|jgi:DNA-binding transcriptional LysR family regulator|nr:LysR family transcriptional regulator [Lacunisphaera sp.]
MPREYQFGFELRHLVYFREVARHLHFRRAAEGLSVAQPALSRQIAQLEEALGTPLFTRSQRRVELTPAGAALLERVEPLLRGLARIPAELHALAGGETGQVRISFTGLAMATVLPGILREFHRRFPGIRLELNESPTAVQLAALQADEIACGFFHPDATTPGLETRQLLRERNGVLLPADHPLARRPALQLRDLAATPFVLFPRAHNPGFFDRILAAFAGVHVTPRIAEEVWPRANAVGLVRAGLGATFMCPSEARELPPEVAFRPLKGSAPESRLVVGWKPADPLAPALAAFLSVAARAESGGGSPRPAAKRGDGTSPSMPVEKTGARPRRAPVA